MSHVYMSLPLLVFLVFVTSKPSLLVAQAKKHGVNLDPFLYPRPNIELSFILIDSIIEMCQDPQLFLIIISFATSLVQTVFSLSHMVT